MKLVLVSLARIATAVLAFAVSLVAAEWLTRALLPQYDPSGQLTLVEREGLVLGPASRVVRQVKNTGDYDVVVRFGPRGFRDRRDVASAAAEDVLFVGDSFTFGWGVETAQRFSSRFEALRGERAFNIAIPGRTVRGYARLLRYAERLGARASRLVVGLSLETDLVVVSELRPRSASSGDAPSALASLRDDPKGWLSARLALYGLMTAAVHRTPVLRGLAVRTGLLVPNLAGVVPPGASEQVVAYVADRVAALASGYDTTVLLIPSRALWLGEHAAAADREHRAVASALAVRGLRVVDVRAAFEASGKPLAMHFENDGHWNARGHRVAAELLARTVPPTPATPSERAP